MVHPPAKVLEEEKGDSRFLPKATVGEPNPVALDVPSRNGDMSVVHARHSSRSPDEGRQIRVELILVDREGMTLPGDRRFELHDLLRSSSRERRTLEVRQSESAAIVHVDRE